MATVERLDPVAVPPPEVIDKSSVANSAIFMLQTVQQHHVTLSQMADQKANIIIGAASVVFALVVSKGSLESLPVSLIILALSAFGAAGLCIFAVMPSIGRPPKTMAPNLLFFGAYSQLSELQWREQMTEVMRTNDNIHDAMLRDIHQMGCVLKDTKFKYLAHGYRVFTYGLAATLVAFAVEQVTR